MRVHGSMHESSREAVQEFSPRRKPKVQIYKRLPRPCAIAHLFCGHCQKIFIRLGRVRAEYLSQP